jgi:hypothetical protein
MSKTCARKEKAQYLVKAITNRDYINDGIKSGFSSGKLAGID